MGKLRPRWNLDLSKAKGRDLGAVLWDLRWDEGTKRKKMDTELTMGLLRGRKVALGGHRM